MNAMTDIDRAKDAQILARIAPGPGATDRFPVSNPATGDQIAEVADMGAEDARQAIARAAAALPAWAAKTARERAAILRRWHDLILANQEALAVLLTREQGKPLIEAMGEVAYGASFVTYRVVGALAG